MKIEIPTHCPCCDSPLETVNEQLFCRNPGCKAQIGKKLEHFCQVLGIKGFGPKTLEKLQVESVIELYYLEKTDLIKSLGSDKMATKLMEELERSKSSDLATVLASFSIPLIGASAAAKLAAVVSHPDQITLEKCKEAGLGDKASSNLMDWLDTEYKELKDFLPFKFSSLKPNVDHSDSKAVCITGKLKSFKTKQEAKAALEQFGYRVVETVTKGLDYLVDESGDMSTKRKKADAYGIKIINDLNQLLRK